VVVAEQALIFVADLANNHMEALVDLVQLY